MPRIKRKFDEMENGQAITVEQAKLAQRELRNRTFNLNTTTSTPSRQNTPIHEPDTTALAHHKDLASALTPYVYQAMKDLLHQLLMDEVRDTEVHKRMLEMPFFKALTEQAARHVSKEMRSQRDKKVGEVSEQLATQIEGIRLMIKPLQKRVKVLSEQLDAALERIDFLEAERK